MIIKALRNSLVFTVVCLLAFSLMACGGAPVDSNSNSSLPEVTITTTVSTTANRTTAAATTTAAQTTQTTQTIITNTSATTTITTAATTATQAARPLVSYTEKITFTMADVKRAAETAYVKPKNVILMIGDGMGLNDIELCKKFCKNTFGFGLCFENLPHVGTAITLNAVSDITDSAASATALATGVKTYNGRLGEGPLGTDYTNVCEIAREEGKKFGIITNDTVCGATPSAFMVHTDSRNNTKEISLQILRSRPDFLAAWDTNDFHSSILSANQSAVMMYEKFTWCLDFEMFAEMLAIHQDERYPSYGLFKFEGDELAYCTQMALQKLKNDKGFFLMVENTGADAAGHGNILQDKVDTVALFDRAVSVAVKFCIENPDTVLVVTSDHETGGVVLPDKKNYTLDEEKFTTTGHSAANVGVFALGYGTERFDGKTVDNTDIGQFLISAVKGLL